MSQIEAMTPAAALPRPELAWLPVCDLGVDERYQRSIERRSSQRLISRIAAEFSWARFGAVMVCARQPNETGPAWRIIDGQHRAAGAAAAGIADVPCIIVPIGGGLAEEAMAFVGANAARVAMSALALQRAAEAAGQPDALAIARICREAGVILLAYPKKREDLRPGETLALGAITALLRRHGAAKAAAILKLLADVYVGQAAMLVAPLIRAVDLLLQGEHFAARQAGLARVLRETLWDDIEDAALRVLRQNRCARHDALQSVLLDLLQGRRLADIGRERGRAA